MNRAERAKTAQETLDIFKRGIYLSGGKQIECQSHFTTEFLTEKHLEIIFPSPGSFEPEYVIVNESVVDTVVRFGGEHCGVLNFASAKNPGGGFLKGSLAQEEALELLTQHDECNFVVSSEDIFADYSSDETKMKTLVGYADRVILFKHKGDEANKFWSRKFGEYDKIEITQSTSTNTGPVVPTRGASKQEHYKREPRVKPEELAAIKITQMCVYNPQIDMVIFAEFDSV